MSSLCGSTNFVWNLTHILGRGVTGGVYQGINRNNGEPVAVKVFNQMSYMRSPEVQMREFEVLKKIQHENIVKLLAIEEEQKARFRNKVIVMELCTGGSLLNIICDPENMFGLHQKDFLLVLEHLTAGMKYLRDHNIVHRDLKPGNIMKFIQEDGSPVYKLTDFGAARELQEDEQFISLCGTEAYLHPDMYERAFLHRRDGTAFDATVDLWSIGVTLYHIATGNLPFQPFGNHRNKETMFYMTTQKESGIISGVQISEKGPIKWNRKLPANCQLSAGLKKYVTPLLAGLLEADTQKNWTFDQFFSEVRKILSKIPIYVFCFNKTESIEIFVHPEETFKEIQICITEQTGVLPTNQILIKNNSLIDSGGCWRSEEPLVLLNTEDNNISLQDDPILLQFPTHNNFISALNNIIIIRNHAILANQACSIGYAYKRRIEKLSNFSLIIQEFVQNFTDLINSNIRKLQTKLRHLKEITHRIKKFVEVLKKSQYAIKKLINSCSHNDSSKIDHLITTLEQISCATEKLIKEKNTCPTKPNQIKASDRAKILVDCLKNSCNILSRDESIGIQTTDQELLHNLERIKMNETGRKLKNLLNDECNPTINNYIKNVDDWYKMAQTIYFKTTILGNDLDSFEDKLRQYLEELFMENNKSIEEISRQVNYQPLKIDHKNFPEFCESLGQNYQEIKEIVQETSSVISEMGELCKLKIN